MKKIILLFLMPVSLKLASYTDSKLITFINNIMLSVMANKATFVDSQLLLPPLKLAIKAFSDACDAVKNGPAGSAAAKDALRVKLETLINSLALSCWQESANSLVTFKLSGFSTRKPFEHIPSLLIPIKLVLKQCAFPNAFQLTFQKVDHAVYYKFRVMLVDGTVVCEETTTDSRKTIITDLKRGEHYFVQVAACSSRVQSGWSSKADAICA